MKPYEDFWLMYQGLCRGLIERLGCAPAWHAIVGTRPYSTAWAGSLVVVLSLAVQTGIAKSQPSEIGDPIIGFGRVFGLGGHACKQYDDTGRLYIYTEGIPSTDIMSWLQRSDGGTKPNVPMPEELEAALPLIPGCLPGKHHADVRTG